MLKVYIVILVGIFYFVSLFSFSVSEVNYLHSGDTIKSEYQSLNKLRAIFTFVVSKVTNLGTHVQILSRCLS